MMGSFTEFVMNQFGFQIIESSRGRLLFHDIVEEEAGMNEERDIFITEAMGLCWHDFDPDDHINTYSLEAYVCTKCKGFILGNNDFSVEEDFSRLLNWVKGQKHFRDFLARFNELDFKGSGKGQSSRDTFADELYLFLKQ